MMPQMYQLQLPPNQMLIPHLYQLSGSTSGLPCFRFVESKELEYNLEVCIFAYIYVE